MSESENNALPQNDGENALPQNDGEPADLSRPSKRDDESSVHSSSTHTSAESNNPAPSGGMSILALCSLVCSVAAVPLYNAFLSLAGIITGHMALGEIRRTGKLGMGMVVFGLIIGYIGVAIFVAFIFVMLSAH